jgi:hypothetical protein
MRKIQWISLRRSGEAGMAAVAACFGVGDIVTLP